MTTYIYDVTDLQNMENDLTADYELANNIDASATSTWNGGAGFVPIGWGTAFTGQLDGKGYKIDQLFINRPTSSIGLFRLIEAGGVVQNLGLTNVDFTGRRVGGIVSLNTGAISKCFVTGTLVGSGSSWAGGLVYDNGGAISNCYARCSVSATWAGGFALSNDPGTIDDCYSTGAVTGSLAAGGFCQYNVGTITNCFWDTETSGQATSDGGTGKTTAEMKTESTFTDAGWDFATIWDIDGVTNDGYPFLLAPTAVSYSQAFIIG